MMAGANPWDSRYGMDRDKPSVLTEGITRF